MFVRNPPYHLRSLCITLSLAFSLVSPSLSIFSISLSIFSISLSILSLSLYIFSISLFSPSLSLISLSIFSISLSLSICSISLSLYFLPLSLFSPSLYLICIVWHKGSTLKILVRNGNPVDDRTTTTKVASVRKQLGTSNEGRQEKNGGVKGTDRSADEHERDWRGADHSGQDTLNGWRITGYRRERQSYVSRARGDEGYQC